MNLASTSSLSSNAAHLSRRRRRRTTRRDGSDDNAQRGPLTITNVARSKGLRRRSKDGPNRSGKVSFFVTVTRRRNSSASGNNSNSRNGNSSSGNNNKNNENNNNNNNNSGEEEEDFSSSSSLSNNNKERVAVIGTLDAFGGWDSRECLQLVQTPNDAEKWTGKIELSDDRAFSKTELKVVLLDQFQNVIQWSPGESFYVELPERCVKYEMTVDWPVDDERLTASSTAKVEVKASENKIETGGAWLAWDGQKPSAKQADAMNASSDEGEKEEVVEATKDDDDDDDDDDNDDDAREGTEKVTSGRSRSNGNGNNENNGNNTDEEDEAGGEDATALQNDLAVELGYSPGSHLSGIRTGLETEIVYSAADQSRGRGVQIGVLEEGELVEIWSEHGTEVGKGMRVGDIYIGTVARVMKGMNALLVDLTGKGPPYALLQKGIDSPAMAWKTKIDWVDRPDGMYVPVKVNRAKGLLRKARKLKLLQEEYGEEAVAKCSQKQLKELMKTSELIKEWEEKQLFEEEYDRTINGSVEEDDEDDDDDNDSSSASKVGSTKKRWESGEWGDLWDGSGGPSPSKEKNLLNRARAAAEEAAAEERQRNALASRSSESWRGAGGRSPPSESHSALYGGSDENDDDDYDESDDEYGGKSKQKDQIPLVSLEPWRLDLSVIKMELAAMKSVELALEAPTNDALDFESDEFMASVAGQMDDIEVDEETGEVSEEWIEEGDGEDGMEILFGAEEVEVDESVDFDESVDEDDEKSNAAKIETARTSSVNGEEEEDFGDDPEAGKRKTIRKIRDKFGVTKEDIRGACATKWEQGQPIVVQVTRLGQFNKGPRVSARPTLPGRNVVLCPDGEGVYVSRKLIGPARKYVKSVGLSVCPSDSALIMRTEAAGVAQDALELDIKRLVDDWNSVKTTAEKLVKQSSSLQNDFMRKKYRLDGHLNLSAKQAHDYPDLEPRRLLNSATSEQVLVRDLFGERISKLYVDTTSAYEAIVDDLTRAGASKEIIDRVVLFAAGSSTNNTDNYSSDNYSGSSNALFQHLGIAKAVESLDDEVIWLDQTELPGAHLVIQRTEALTAIDVNAGRSAMKKEGADNDELARRVNIEAAKTVAKTLRLRDIGGLVMIDLIDMEDEGSRREVEVAFESIAKRDRAQLTFLPISPLGVMEVARERMQTHGDGGMNIIADEKGMPIEPDDYYAPRDNRYSPNSNRGYYNRQQHSMSARNESYNQRGSDGMNRPPRRYGNNNNNNSNGYDAKYNGNNRDFRDEDSTGSGSRRRRVVRRNFYDSEGGRGNSNAPPWVDGGGRGRGRGSPGRGGRGRGSGGRSSDSN